MILNHTRTTDNEFKKPFELTRSRKRSAQPNRIECEILRQLKEDAAQPKIQEDEDVTFGNNA